MFIGSETRSFNTNIDATHTIVKRPNLSFFDPVYLFVNKTA